MDNFDEDLWPGISTWLSKRPRADLRTRMTWQRSDSLELIKVLSPDHLVILVSLLTDPESEARLAPEQTDRGPVGTVTRKPDGYFLKGPRRPARPVNQTENNEAPDAPASYKPDSSNSAFFVQTALQVGDLLWEWMENALRYDY